MRWPSGAIVAWASLALVDTTPMPSMPNSESAIACGVESKLAHSASSDNGVRIAASVGGLRSILGPEQTHP